MQNAWRVIDKKQLSRAICVNDVLIGKVCGCYWCLLYLADIWHAFCFWQILKNRTLYMKINHYPIKCVFLLIITIPRSVALNGLLVFLIPHLLKFIKMVMFILYSCARQGRCLWPILPYRNPPTSSCLRDCYNFFRTNTEVSRIDILLTGKYWVSWSTIVCIHIVLIFSIALFFFFFPVGRLLYSRTVSI